MRGIDGHGFDLEFYPLTFAQAAEGLLSAHEVLSACCEGTQFLGECKPHPDVPDPVLMCKPGTFQPSQTIPMGVCRSPHHSEDKGIRSECWDMECRLNKTHCESKRWQMEDGEMYASDLTYFPTTCSEVQRHNARINMVEKGECGEWMEDHHGGRWFESRCHDTKCRTPERCASMGYEFRPLSQADAESRNKGTIHHYFGSGSESASKYGICCGGAENLQEGHDISNYPYSTEKVVPDGYIVDQPKKGCSKCECCGEGTVCKDGLCYPTFEGAMQACKKERGEKWAWTCDGEAQCSVHTADSANGNARRLQNKPKPSNRWSKGWHTAKPARRRAASRPSSQRSSRPSSLFHHRRR